MGAEAWDLAGAAMVTSQHLVTSWSRVDTPSVLYVSGIVPFVIPTTNNSLDSWNVGQVPLTDSSQDSWVWGGLCQQTVLNTVGVWGSLQTSPGQWSLQYFLGEMAPDTGCQPEGNRKRTEYPAQCPAWHILSHVAQGPLRVPLSIGWKLKELMCAHPRP